MDSKYLSNGTFTTPYVRTNIGEEKYKQCAHFIKESQNITIITGAGLSTDSGIPCFRGNDGIYSEIPESFFTLDEFKKNPRKFYSFMKKLFSNKKPNKAHYLLTELQRKYKDKNINILTQNIDELQENSGFKKVIHVHGDIKQGYCLNCGRKIKKLNFNRYECNCIADFNTYSCKTTNGLIRPDIVFYGEDIKDQEKCINILKNTDLLIVLGTSLSVEPVASFPKWISALCPIIIINKEPTYLDEDRMSVSFKSDITETLLKIMEYV